MRVKSMLVANDRNSPDQLTNSEAGQQMLLGPESKQPLQATIHSFSRTHDIHIHSIVRSHPPVAACSYSATCTTDPSAGLENAIDRFPIHTAVVFTSQLYPAILKQQASVLAAVFQTFPHCQQQSGKLGCASSKPEAVKENVSFPSSG
jgi:hypothetical protein